MAYRFSCAYRPGATNSQICQRMTGAASTSPTSAAAFICTMKNSAGSV
jgi:hypothetical protein